MAKYYATISGLPNIGVDDRKLPFSSELFVEELREVLTSSDFKLLEMLRWERDNRFLIDYLESPEKALEADEQPQLLSYEEVAAVVDALKKGTRLPKHHLPAYIIDFLKDFVIEKDEEDDVQDDEEEVRMWPLRLEDKLADYYYTKFALPAKNNFVAEWSRLNLDIRNVFAAFTSRNLGWDPKDYIVGDSEVERKLKTSTATNFGLSEEEMEYIAALTSVQNETDITRRERMLDVLKWNWLEERVFDRTFNVETILAYYLQLRIIERWTELNEKTGEETFRSIVATLKKESNDSLNEFKRNQKK